MAASAGDERMSFKALVRLFDTFQSRSQTDGLEILSSSPRGFLNRQRKERLDIQINLLGLSENTVLTAQNGAEAMCVLEANRARMKRISVPVDFRKASPKTSSGETIAKTNHLVLDRFQSKGCRCVRYWEFKFLVTRAREATLLCNER